MDNQQLASFKQQAEAILHGSQYPGVTEVMADYLLQVIEAYEALRAATLADCRAGYIETSKIRREEGYDSLRFADVRAGWLESTEHARRILGWDYHHIADIDAAFDEEAAEEVQP